MASTWHTNSKVSFCSIYKKVCVSVCMCVCDSWIRLLAKLLQAFANSSYIDFPTPCTWCWHTSYLCTKKSCLAASTCPHDGRIHDNSIVFLKSSEPLRALRQRPTCCPAITTIATPSSKHPEWLKLTESNISVLSCNVAALHVESVFACTVRTDVWSVPHISFCETYHWMTMNNKEEQHSRCFVPNHEDNKKNCLAIRRQLRRTILILVDANSDQTWANSTFDPKENRQGVTDPTASPKNPNPEISKGRMAG